ncbi:hypothetical protein ACQEVY_23345 [Streptomyces sp. CA-288835]|uniref:hypothetical protein n=1 Tax=Streptomyces sp. CA-288835 TaxID=3240069 RepID=UPI003D912003
MPEPQPITRERLDEIRAMRFTTQLNPATGHFETETERELYVLAASCWNALQDLLRDHEHLTSAHSEASEQLAEWEGALAP